MTENEQTFPCPNCGQLFEWRREFAGRKLGCACGAMVQVPEPQIDTYDFKDEIPGQPVRAEPIEEPPPGKLVLDSDGNELVPVPSAPPTKVLNYRRAGSIEQPLITDLTRAQFRDFWVPFGLIGLSIVALAILALVISSQPFTSAPGVVLNLGFRAIWDIAITLVAGMIIYGFIDSGIGEMHVAILKLTALGLFRFSISAVAAPDGQFPLMVVGFAITLPIVMFLFYYFFEFELGQSALCTIILTFTRMISYFGLWTVLR